MKKSEVTMLIIGFFSVILLAAGAVIWYISTIDSRSSSDTETTAETEGDYDDLEEEEQIMNPLVKKHGSYRYLIANPQAGEALSSPLPVIGSITGNWYFEGQFPIELRSPNGEVLSATTAVALDDWTSEEMVRFEAFFEFDPGTLESGFIVLIKANPSDLPENEDSIALPIHFSHELDAMTVNVYLGNELLDPESVDCSIVFPSTRTITRTQAVGRASLEELLLGTTEDEEMYGYYSSIPGGVTINSIEIEDGVAHVDFNQSLQEGVGGSCRVTRIRSQIEQTLMQFSTVSSVVISIGGDTDLILQP